MSRHPRPLSVQGPALRPISRWLALLIVATVVLACTRTSQPAPDGAWGPCAVSSQVVKVGGRRAWVSYPGDQACGQEIAAPYPAVAFAHGFTMYGLFNGAKENRGSGERLSSWGYVVAIPRLPDQFDARTTSMQRVLSWLEQESAAEDSALYQKVDPERLALAGHSLGGATALRLAGLEPRIRAVVALDPVYHTGGPGGGEALWEPEQEAPQIEAPTLILGAPASSCNADADHARIRPWVGAQERASYTLVGASHCDFGLPSGALCGAICGQAPDPARIELALKYMTAWFNAYLYQNAEAYETVYGAGVEADIENALIEAH